MIRSIVRASRTFVAFAAFVCASSAMAQAPSWLDPAASTRANAGTAARSNVSPADATAALLAAGDDAAHTVQAVIAAYDRCDAVSESVRVATATTPARVGDIVQAATASGRCPCSSESLWAQTRLQRRIRIEQRAEPVQVAPICGCAAIAAEAAVATAPERADDVIDAALLAQRRAEAVVDSLGQVGAPRGPGSIAPRLNRIDGKRCARDTDTQDAFALGDAWQQGETDPSALVPDGARCEGEGTDDARDDLSLAAYVASGNDHALVLYNGGDEPVAFASERYQVDFYFPEARDPGRRIALNGTVQPGAYYVVAGRNADPAWQARADQIVDGTLLAPSEAVVLRRGLSRAACDCAQAAVAGTVNGLGPAAPAWIEQRAGERGGTRLVTADSVGQTRPAATPADAWQSPLAPAPLALARADGACTADRTIDDPFATGADWAAIATGATDVAPRCAAASDSVLLAGFRAWTQPEREAPSRAVDLFNATGATIDLARDGYVLEVYADGEAQPHSVVRLDGELAAGARLAVASPAVPGASLPPQVQRSDALEAPKLDAVVLRRIAARNDEVCPVDVYAAVQVVGEGPVVIAAGPPTDVDGEPRTDELPIDPDRGGDLASPN